MSIILIMFDSIVRKLPLYNMFFAYKTTPKKEPTRLKKKLMIIIENVIWASNINDRLTFIKSKLKISHIDGMVSNNAMIVLAISTDEKYSLAFLN